MTTYEPSGKKVKDKGSARAMRPPIQEKLTQGFYTMAFPQPSESMWTQVQSSNSVIFLIQMMKFTNSKKKHAKPGQRYFSNTNDEIY